MVRTHQPRRLLFFSSYFPALIPTSGVTGAQSTGLPKLLPVLFGYLGHFCLHLTKKFYLILQDPLLESPSQLFGSSQDKLER